MVILRRFVWILAALLVGCSSVEVLPTLPTQTLMPVTPTLASIPPATPTFQLIATPTATEATPSSTAVISPETILKYQPMEVASKLPADANPAGILILNSGQQIYRLNFDQQVKQKISGAELCPATSPDGKWLAYCQRADGSLKNFWLIVENADGQQENRFRMGEDWSWDLKVMWLDNERLVFNVGNHEALVSGIYPVVVVNPFTGKWQEVASDYPDLTGSMSGPAGTIQFVYSTVVYDPSLNLVIYPQGHENVVLWDRQAQRALASITDLGEFQHVPLWSPDGKQFVIAITHQWDEQSDKVIEEWFSVSREGKVRQLTHFGDYFADAKIGRANWSPDGRRLAFWLDAKPSQCEGQNLAVLELEMQQVTDYCVLGSGDPIAPASSPVWSLDGHYIAVDSFESQNSPSYVILVDTVQGWAAQIDEEAYPVGWLTEP